MVGCQGFATFVTGQSCLSDKRSASRLSGCDYPPLLVRLPRSDSEIGTDYSPDLVTGGPVRGRCLGMWRSLVALLAGSQAVLGSIPSISTILTYLIFRNLGSTSRTWES